MNIFKRKGDFHFTDDSRGAGIANDLVLQARAKMSEHQVHGPEDAAVSEMTKQLLQEKIIPSRSAFRNDSWVRWKPRVHGRKIVKLVFLRTPEKTVPLR